MNASGSSSLQKFYGYKETFDDETVWVDIPSQLTFVHITDPYNDEAALQTPFVAATHAEHGGDSFESLWQSSDNLATSDAQASMYGLEALSAAASGKNYSYPLPPTSMEHHRSLSGLSGSQQPFFPAQSSSSQNLNFILNQAEPEALSPPIDPRLHADLTESSPTGDGAPYNSEGNQPRSSYSINGDDTSFLVRHFSEGPGHWMDLFDLGRFFEVDVPVKASTCPLLLYSAAALAAKSLGRLGNEATKLKGPALSYTPEQWLHKAATYYDSAIHLLREALANSTHAMPDIEDQSAERPTSSGSFARNRNSRSPGLPRTDSNELVGTTAILCVYEFLDGSGAEWSRHLDGAKTLFDIAKDSVMSMPTESPSAYRSSSFGQRPSSNSRRAIFWNITRQDMLEAFINSTSSRLDASDLDMWRSAGLHISDTGFIVPSNDPKHHEPMHDDMISNAMVWLVMRLVNFIAASKEDSADIDAMSFGLSLRQKPSLEEWQVLEQQVDTWYDGLPDSFRPASTTWPALQQASPNRPSIPKKWFARPMCASTMQWYHFARLQLLNNKPPATTGNTPFATIDSQNETYATIQQQNRIHAQEIISIGLAQADEGMRVHSVQPLYVAGKYLGRPEDASEEVAREITLLRAMVLALLRDLERDTGWATGYRVKQLLDQWGLYDGWGEEFRPVL